MNTNWGRTQWLFPEEELLHTKNKKGRNIGEWSETLATLHCLLFPNIIIDGVPHKVRAVEHKGVSVSVDAVKSLDMNIVENRIYRAIYTKQDNSGSFDINDDLIKNTLTAIGMESGVKGSPNQKHDIILHLADQDKPLGFNIKSLLGADPSIINASQQTSIRYRLKNPKIDVHDINSSIAKIGVFSDKIKFLRTICDDVISEAYTSEAYKNVLSGLDEYAFLYVADWLLTFFEHKRHAFIDTDIDLSWFNKFIIMSMTKIKPKIGAEDSDECGLAFLYNTISGPRLHFTMGNDPTFSKQLCKYIRFERPSFSRHKKYMLEKLDDDFSFRLPMQIRLQSSVKELFK
jgi:hypothetical protein